MSQRTTTAVRQHVQQLLGQGLLHRQVISRTGLSRSCVRQIADECGASDSPDLTQPADDHPADYDEKNLARCAGCGGMVYLWPCLLCQMANKPCEKPTKPRCQVARKEQPSCERISGAKRAQALWMVVVECTGEQEQQEVYEQLTTAGRACKVRTM